MIESVLLRDLGLMVAGAAVLSALTRRIGVPGVVAYMVAGLILGPMTGLVEVSEAVAVLSELGVAFLLFLVGLELSVDRVREVGRVALVAGTLQVLLTFGGGLGIALLLGFSLPASLVIGLAVTFSSTAVVVKLLAERRELATRSGRITIGILLVQDIVVVISLTLMGALGGEEAASGGGGLVLPFLALAGLCLVAWAAAGTLLPRLFRWISATGDALFVWSISWCMLFVVASELVHLPLEIGAFLAGVALAQLPEAHPLGRRLGPLTNFFLAVFFVGLGIQMDPGAAGSRLGAVAVLVAFVLLGKSVLLIWILGRSGEDRETSFRTGLSLAQVSEFSFVLAALAAQAGYLDDVGLSVIGVVGLVTIAASSLLLVRRDALYDLFRESTVARMGGHRPSREGTASAARKMAGPEADSGDVDFHGVPSTLEAHVIVVGMNTLGRALVERLAREGHVVVAVDRDPQKLSGLSTPTLVGDVERLDVLDEANLAGARLLVSALQIEDTNKLLAHQAREAGVPSSIHAFNPSVEEELVAAGASHLMDPKHEGARSFAERLRELGILAAPPGGRSEVGESTGLGEDPA